MRLGLIAGVLVLFAVIGIGSFVAYKMLFPAEPKEVVTAPDASKAADSAPAQPAMDAPKDGAAPAGTAAGSTDNNMSSQQAPAAAPAPDTAAAPPPPAPDAAKAAAAKAAADAKAKAAASGKSDTPSMSNAPVAPTPSSPRQAAAPATAPSPQPDRWEQMRQAYELCNKESLFDRLGCNSRVGQQYCKGYWGTVPQCPAGAYGDRANN